jgi:pre-rRNA-processing protein TSR3
MRSSTSTRSPPSDRPIRLYLLVAGEDHPKACTGRKLIHRGLVREVPRIDHSASAPVVLDPYSVIPLSRADVGRARRCGVLAVDCSWNRLAGRGRYPTPTANDRARARRLPWLLAANPQHYGRISELNTAEALAAALVVLGARPQAARLLEGLRGGEAFFTLNAERLLAYERAGDREQVLAAERGLFSPPEP